MTQIRNMFSIDPTNSSSQVKRAFRIVRQFAAYNLRTKLILAFLVVSLLSIGVVAFVADYTNRQVLLEKAGANVKAVANLQASALGNLLIRQVETLQTLSLNKLLQDAVEAISVSYTGDPRAEVEALDQQWRAAGDTVSLVQARLNNELASELRKFQDTFPNHVELLITDQYGALVAATDRPPDYDEWDEEWWQAAFNNGAGSIYISQPTINEDISDLGIIIAVPLYAHNTRSVVGVLRTVYRATALQDLLVSVEGTIGHTDLLLPEGQLFTPDTNTLVLSDPDTLAQLQASAAANYAEFTFEGEPNLVSQAPVTAITGESTIAALGWTLVVHQPRAEVLASVEAQTQSTVLLALVIAGVVAGAAVILARQLTSPITRLTNVARQVAGGNLAAQVQVESADEVGALAAAINAMTGQLREVIGALEEQVAERTQQLETVVAISQRLTGILDLSDLLRQVVIIIKETFDYYHAHIYLLDDKGETLVMAEGYGEAGQEMKRQGHSISLYASKSLVARAAREGRIITVENVREDPNWLPNTLLPDTHSEMAVPVMSGGKVVGVLDVQSQEIGGLTGQDEAVLQALANQIATAVRNAYLFTETQEKLYEAERLQRLYTSQAWEKLSATRTTTDYEFRQPTLIPLAETPTPEVMAALQQKRTVDLRLPISNSELGNGDGQPQAQNALATPLKLRNEIIGVLGIHHEDAQHRWTDDEITLIEAISEQMSLALENARLFEETQRNAWRDRVVSESTAKVWSTAEIEEVLKATVAQLGNTLRASEVTIRLGTEDELIQE